jgi:hypothetical protein
MASETDVANMALAMVGESAILSIDDPIKAARVCKVQLPLVKREMLRQHPWNAYKKRVVLAKDATDPAFGFNSRFALPVDFIMVALVQAATFTGSVASSGLAQVQNDHEVEGDFMLANGDSINLTYIHDGLISLADPLQAKAFASALAFRICMVLKDSSQLKASLKEDALFDLKRAKQRNAADRPPQAWHTDTIVNARVDGARNIPTPGFD